VISSTVLKHFVHQFNTLVDLLNVRKIEEKWIRKKKEFIKLHIAVDEMSEKVVSFRITRGNVHDTKQFGPLIKESAKKHDIDKVYGDKAYDNRKNFNILDDINAEPAISIRKNASTISKRCPLRRDELLLIKKLGYEGWKQLKDAGKYSVSYNVDIFV
jgi:Transposase DDE domain